VQGSQNSIRDHKSIRRVMPYKDLKEIIVVVFLEKLVFPSVRCNSRATLWEGER
jgi:hypothetical protein